MIPLKQTLARLGLTELNNILGANTLEHLELLNEKEFLKSSQLADLVIKRIGPETILLTPKFRENLFQALKREQVVFLLEKYSVSKSDNPWKDLIERFKRPKKDDYSILFEAFGLRYEVAPDYEMTPETVLEPMYSLFDYQIEASKKVLNYFQTSDVPRVLLHMPTDREKPGPQWM